jgi:hypothetical protein
MPKILIKRGTAAQWTASTTALLAGELGLDTSNNILKVGNGTSLWNSLSGLTLTSTQVNELAQDAISTAFSNGTHTNITVTYNDNANSISLSTGPDVVTTTSLNNTLTDSQTGYVPISDVGNQDGVAPLDSNSLIPDEYIPSTIARDSEIPSLAGYATEAYVGTAISNLVDSAPSTLNTLNELAAALNDDANYATTITNALSLKAPLASPTFTGEINLNGTSSSYLESAYSTHTGSLYLDNTGIYLDTYSDDGNDFAGISTEQGILSLFTNYGDMYFDNLGLQILSNSADTAQRLGVYGNTINPLVVTGNTTTFAGTVNFTGVTVNGLDSKLSITDPSVDYYITNNGSGSYTVNGVANGPIEFVKGKKYRIHINASGHPFWIQTVSGAYSAGNVYSTGITGNGTQVGHIIVELPQNAPDNLYYACQFHSSMAGAVLVRTDNISFNLQSSNYTLTTSDAGRLIEMSGGGTLTITDSTSFPIGFYVDVLQTGSSQVTIAGTSFTPDATPGLKLRTRWSSATLIKRALNSWVVLGDLSA